MASETTAQVGERVMNTDELRDWHAREAGYERTADKELWKGPHGAFRAVKHPFPPTLDGAASAMPEGWSLKLVIHNGLVQGITWPSKLGPLESPVNIRPSFFYENECEKNVRFMLAKLAKEAMNAHPR